MEFKKYYTAVSILMGAAFALSIISYFLQPALYGWYNWPHTILLLFGIVGLIIFISSGFKKSALLRIYMCREIFLLPFTLYSYFSFFLLQKQNTISIFDVASNWMFYFSVVINILFAAASIIGLWYFSKQKTALITYFGEGENRVGQFEPTTAGKRFANYCIDQLVISIGVLANYVYLQYSFEGFFDQYGERIILYLISIPSILFYYLLLEGIFNTSAGKCATNTIVVDADGNNPSIGKRIGRSFCRLIPFDAISFLSGGARGWHDSITGTYVVNCINKDELADYEIILDAELALKNTA
jgi:RDD family